MTDKKHKCVENGGCKAADCDSGQEDLPQPLSEGDAVDLLLMVAGQLGWEVMIPEVADDEQVPGLIIGKPEYVEWIEGQLTETKVPQHLRTK